MMSTVFISGNPAIAVIKRSILAREINTFIAVAGAAALRKGACAGAEVGADGGVLRDPVGQAIFTILDDTTLSRSVSLCWKQKRRREVLEDKTYALEAS